MDDDEDAMVKALVRGREEQKCNKKTQEIPRVSDCDCGHFQLEGEKADSNETEFWSEVKSCFSTATVLNCCRDHPIVSPLNGMYE